MFQNEATENKIIEAHEEASKIVKPDDSTKLNKSSSLSSFQLPLPPSKNQILDNLEDIKQQYREQEKEWNILLNNSKKQADEKLKKFLEQHKQI